MKIFSSFDTKHRDNELCECQVLHGDDKALLVTRSKLYYRIFFLTPIIMICLCIVIAVLTVSMYTSGKSAQYTITGVIILGLITIGVIRYKSYLYYYLDFLIITPEKIDIYDQLDLIHKNIKSLFTHEIKGIYVDKGGFRNSVLNQGNITVESHADDHEKLFFGPVSNPDEVKKRIEQILNKY